VKRLAAEPLLNKFVESLAAISPRNRAQIALDPTRRFGVWISKILRDKVKENDYGGSPARRFFHSSHNPRDGIAQVAAISFPTAQKPKYPSRQARTPFGILLPRICWKTGMTFVLSRNSSDTATSALQ